MSKIFKILTINPGSTSTKIAVFDNEDLVFEKTLRHSSEEIGKYEGGPGCFRQTAGVPGPAPQNIHDNKYRIPKVSFLNS